MRPTILAVMAAQADRLAAVASTKISRRPAALARFASRCYLHALAIADAREERQANAARIARLARASR
jgi:hypothetical protein